MDAASLTPHHHDARARGLDVIPMTFLILSPAIGLAGTAVYTALHGFHLWMLLLGLAMYAAVGLSITVAGCGSSSRSARSPGC